MHEGGPGGVGPERYTKPEYAQTDAERPKSSSRGA